MHEHSQKTGKLSDLFYNVGPGEGSQEHCGESSTNTETVYEMQMNCGVRCGVVGVPDVDLETKESLELKTRDLTCARRVFTPWNPHMVPKAPTKQREHNI